ncbi:2-dehydro-3-deoxygluconokinase [Tahibacter aquaticus]|uniref:2-dehydro-3-deoxygluconokinase n=1 Tax=Tahibacter aquaticus TaxID=520092 RepID=A0A4R6YNB6_9GAMM|nr:sugar kinase [Tahibacter aquaticus]TDR39100.1 2-dehydro-3-deoxygluconokinase [Tahibacter aquaticus]
MSNRILCFGELLLRLASPGRELLLQSPRLDVHIGGAEANVAIALAHFGHAVGMIGSVADNSLGRAAIAELRRQGVDARAVTVRPGRMGLYFLETGALQRPSEVLYDRADSAFARTPAAAYDWPVLLRGAQLLHLSGVTPALGQACADTAIAAARAARALGLQVVFDGNFRAKLWQAWQSDAASILRELLACADTLFADHRDISVVLGREFAGAEADRAAAAAAFDTFPHVRNIVSTRRLQHSVDRHDLAAQWFTRRGEIQLPAQRLDGIVDRIGGGDAFAAGVLHGLQHGWDDEQSLRFGLAAACLKHSLPGDFLALDEARVRSLMDEARFDVRR